MNRQSKAALAWISRTNVAHKTEYLTQWNNNWNAYSLIGGHVESGESFRQCCMREIAEELRCGASDCELAPYPCAMLRYREFSQAAHEETDYHWQLFLARPSANLLRHLPSECQWVTADQILAGRTADGMPIADQVKRVLEAINEAECDLNEVGHSIAASSASLALLIGDTERQRKLAEAVLHICSHIALEGRESIWVLVSEGEAALLLGDLDSAIRFYRSALHKTLPHETGIIDSMYHQLCRLHWARGPELVQPVIELFNSGNRLANRMPGPFGDCRLEVE